MEETRQSISNPMEANEGKMFIGGLHSQTSSDSLRAYFEKYGEVKEAVVMRDTVTKRSRGFGFIVFNDLTAVDKVLEFTDCHIIDGKKVDPKRAVPKKATPGANQPFRKVFVGGLPGDVTAAELQEYFEAFGKVTECLLMQDRQTKRLRGFGFVTFENEAASKAVCDAGFHKLKGKNVECKRAQPKEVMLLQGKGRDLLAGVNLPPFQLNRSSIYPNGIPTSPIAYGVPDYASSPQLYQQLVNWMSMGRGKAFTAQNYVTAGPPQGFGNMPDHRRHASSQQTQGAATTQHQQAQYFNSDYNNTATTASAVTTETPSPQNQDYHHISSGLTQTTTRPNAADMSFLSSRTTFGNDQAQIYHGAQAASQPAFGHASLPPITLRH